MIMITETATRAELEEAIEHHLITREHERDPRRLWVIDTRILDLARAWASLDG